MYTVKHLLVDSHTEALNLGTSNNITLTAKQFQFYYKEFYNIYI